MKAREELLARWEAGEISDAEVGNLLGDEGAKLLELHRELYALASEPTPDPAEAWPALAARLEPRSPGLLARLATFARPLQVALGTALLVSGIAVASPASRDAARSAIAAVWEQLFASPAEGGGGRAPSHGSEGAETKQRDLQGTPSRNTDVDQRGENNRKNELEESRESDHYREGHDERGDDRHWGDERNDEERDKEEEAADKERDKEEEAADDGDERSSRGSEHDEEDELEEFGNIDDKDRSEGESD